jgi:AcrR family transcriptional regulator
LECHYNIDNVSSVGRAALPPRRAPATPRGRKARERARRQAEVLAAARELFGRRGYNRTTMVEVAAASELALGTLYQLFPSKAAILYGLLENHIDRLIERARLATAETDDARLQLRRLVATLLGFARENADVLRLYLNGWTGYEFEVRQRYGDRIDAKYEAYLDVLEGVFRRGLRTGVFVEGPTRRPALALAGMLHALIRRWLRERRLDLAAEGDAIVTLILRGVVRPARNGSRR